MVYDSLSLINQNRTDADVVIAFYLDDEFKMHLRFPSTSYTKKYSEREWIFICWLENEGVDTKILRSIDKDIEDKIIREPECGVFIKKGYNEVFKVKILEDGSKDITLFNYLSDQTEDLLLSCASSLINFLENK